MKPGRGYNNMNHIDKNFQFPSILYTISRSLSISITNVGLMEFLEEIIFREQKMERMSQISMTSIVKEHIRYHCLLTEIKLCTLVFSEIEHIFQDILNKIKDK